MTVHYLMCVTERCIPVLQESVDVVVRWTEHNEMKITSLESNKIIINFARKGNFRNTIPIKFKDWWKGY